MCGCLLSFRREECVSGPTHTHPRTLLSSLIRERSVWVWLLSSPREERSVCVDTHTHHTHTLHP